MTQIQNIFKVIDTHQQIKQNLKFFEEMMGPHFYLCTPLSDFEHEHMGYQGCRIKGLNSQVIEILVKSEFGMGRYVIIVLLPN